jgi:NADH:ubiquinone oxidoreductase subunit 4 (subunit M)
MAKIYGFESSYRATVPPLLILFAIGAIFGYFILGGWNGLTVVFLIITGSICIAFLINEKNKTEFRNTALTMSFLNIILVLIGFIMSRGNYLLAVLFPLICWLVWIFWVILWGTPRQKNYLAKP